MFKTMVFRLGMVALSCLPVFANCPTPTGAHSWFFYSFVGYASAVAFGETTTIDTWGMRPDIDSGLATWTSANYFANPSFVNFYSVTFAPQHNWYAHSYADGVFAERIAVTSLFYYSGSGRLYSADTSFFLGNATFVNPNGANFHSLVTKFTLHEAGHTMGLNDQPIVLFANCAGQNPGQSVMNVSCGVNDFVNNMPLTVTVCDNSSVH